jgi:hypothetical protein
MVGVTRREIFAARLGLSLLCLLTMTAGCGDGSPASPSPQPLSLAVSAPVQGHSVQCSTCADPMSVVVEFQVTISDLAGPGGTLASLEIKVLDTLRGAEIARNVRPNADVGLSGSALPAGGQLAVAAGVAFQRPASPDTLVVVTAARLTDGREGSISVPLAIVD